MGRFEEKSSEIALLVRSQTEARLDMERFSIRLFLKISFLASLSFLFFFLTSSLWAQQEAPSQPEKEDLPAMTQETQPEEEEVPTWEEETSGEKEEFITFGQMAEKKKKFYLSRGQKALLLNAGAMAAVLIYGFAKWDYGESSFNFKSEDWFERTSKYGGADKLGHFWSSYAMSHLFSYFYHKWGYTESQANLYGALSNLGFQTFMEAADGFSPSNGFSYEDVIMNIAGTAVGYIWGKYPSLARKIDFRIEYKPTFSSDDFGFSTNYERQKFLIAIKASGFNFIKNPYLKYLEFHVGYYARGYEDFEEGGPDHRRRKIYVGLGFNVSRLVQKYVNTTVLDYIQIPYTSITKTVTSD
jgi:uncharacterized protein YfiM (DUF2279 family)